MTKLLSTIFLFNFLICGELYFYDVKYYKNGNEVTKKLVFSGTKYNVQQVDYLIFHNPKYSHFLYGPIGHKMIKKSNIISVFDLQTQAYVIDYNSMIKHSIQYKRIKSSIKFIFIFFMSTMILNGNDFI
tara:strand:+ start:970 stop:1356 length:387 start_codon:yes stop_codon:yes gene_type:complete